jgi:hypothetical protein
MGWSAVLLPRQQLPLAALNGISNHVAQQKFQLVNVSVGSKVDIDRACWDVRFVPKAEVSSCSKLALIRLPRWRAAGRTKARQGQAL